MKRERKRGAKIFAFALAAAMVCMTIPAMSLADTFATTDTETTVIEEPTSHVARATVAQRTNTLDLRSGYVKDKDDTALTDTNGVYDLTSTEGWKWDINTKTLTLSGCDINVKYKDAIVFPANTTIELVGANKAESGALLGLKMSAAGNLTIKGTGSLDVVSKNQGILSYGDISISSGTINVRSHTDHAISAEGKIEISGSSNVTANGNFCGLTAPTGITISDATVVAYSVYDNAIFTNGALVIKGSANVTSTSESYCALQGATGIDISGGTVNAISLKDSAIFTPSALTVSNADVTASGYFCGLQGNGSVTIDKGIVDAKSSNDTAVFTAGILKIDGGSDVTATGGDYCALKANVGMIINDCTLDAKALKDTAIFTPGTLEIGENADITSTGKNCGLQSNDSMVINGKVNASGGTHAVYTDKALTTGSTADLTAGSTNTIDEGFCALFSGNDMTINGGTVNATSKKGMSILSQGTFTADKDSNITSDGYWAALFSTKKMTLNGTLQATGNDSTAIMSDDEINIGETANITAVSANEGGIFGLKGITTAGTIDAQGGGNSAIISYGKIDITGGVVHAKGAPGTAAIFTYSTQQTVGENASAQITIGNYIEKSGAKLSFSDWATNDGEQTSWTSFILNDDSKLSTNDDGTMKNAVNEVFLAAPYTVTFDVNGGTGETSTVKIYPNNTVIAPETNPSKEGCHFNGWYLDGAEFDFASAEITKDILLTAQFSEHIAGEWVVDKESTESETGKKHKACTVCGEVIETETIPMIVATPETTTTTTNPSTTTTTAPSKGTTTPKTGDNSNVALFTGAFAVAGIAIAVLAIRKKKISE